MKNREHFLSRNASEISFLLTPYVIAILTLLFTPRIHAKELTLDDLHIEAKSSVGESRDFHMPDGEEKKGELNLGLAYSKGMLYNKLKVRGFYGHQFRHVSLETEAGVKFSDFEIFVEHYSGHAMDAEYGTKYPKTNALGARIRFK